MRKLIGLGVVIASIAGCADDQGAVLGWQAAATDPAIGGMTVAQDPNRTANMPAWTMWSDEQMGFHMIRTGDSTCPSVRSMIAVCTGERESPPYFGRRVQAELTEGFRYIRASSGTQDDTKSTARGQATSLHVWFEGGDATETGKNEIWCREYPATTNLCTARDNSFLAPNGTGPWQGNGGALYARLDSRQVAHFQIPDVGTTRKILCVQVAYGGNAANFRSCVGYAACNPLGGGDGGTDGGTDSGDSGYDAPTDG